MVVNSGETFDYRYAGFAIKPEWVIDTLNYPIVKVIPSQAETYKSPACVESMDRPRKGRCAPS